MDAFKLYSFFRSSASWRVRIALSWKNLPYETIPINIRTGEHRGTEFGHLNPGRLVPALDVGEATIGQSMAILEYLEETYPEPALLPIDRVARARVRGFAQHIACEIHPMNNLRTLNFLKSDLQIDPAIVQEKWYSHWIRDGFKSLEALVEGSRFCFGNSVTLADVALVPQMANATRFHVDVTDFPKLTSISKNLETIPAFQAAVPEIQPDRALYEPV